MTRKKTKDVLQWVEVDTTSPHLVGSVSVRISPDVTLSGDRVSALDDEQLDDIDKNVELFAATETKMNPRKWVKKCES